uniref:Uncharacterized protein n=1 Tax=viral metagenome TaxID=1070528 RepID=A0A6M3Y3V5_9ZZZZ
MDCPNCQVEIPNEPSLEQLQEFHLHHTTNYLGLAYLLIQKGLITDDELDKAHAWATHLVDQIAAQKKEEADREEGAQPV